jgi:Flp pilus assembly protein TadG
MKKFNRLKKLAADRSGQFSIMLAVALPMLGGAVGFAVDLSNQQRVKFDLQNATDAAVLAATDLGKDGVKEDEVRKRIRSFFLAACPVANCAKAVTQTTTITGDRVRVDASTDVKTFFMGILGQKTVQAEARSEITIGQEAVYYEVHMALDNTGSMNIVDGLDEIRRFRGMFKPWSNDPGNYCALACHIRVDDGTKDANGKPNMMTQTGADIARANGVPLREDRIRQTMTDTAKDLIAAGNSKRLKVATYDFGWGVWQRSAPTTNFAAVKASIDKMPWLSDGTQYDYMSGGLIRYVGPSGDGRTEKTPKKVIILITDGVSQKLQSEGNGIKVIPQIVCDNLKKDGRQLIVLNMVYPDPLEIGNTQYGSRDKIILLRPKLEPALKACASPGKYYEAKYGASITKAFENIKKDIIKEARSVYLAY